MIRRDPIELIARRQAAFGECGRAVVVERRRSDGHRDDPLPGRTVPGQRSDPCEHVGDRRGTGERGPCELDPLGVHMGVRVVEARDDRRGAEVDDLCCVIAVCDHRILRPDRQDPVPADGDRLRSWTAAIEGNDVAEQDETSG